MFFPWKRDILGEEDDVEDQPLLLPVSRDDAQQGDDDDKQQVKSTRIADDFVACRDSGELTEADLLTRLSDKVLAVRLRRLGLNAQTALQEQGVHTLYLAFGLLRWYESNESDETLQAPLLLVPVKLSRPSLDSRWELLVAEEEVIPNYCLIQMLTDSFDLKLPEIDDDALLDSKSGLDDFVGRVRSLISPHERWSIEDSAILGIFTFQKIAMWKDLEDNREKIARHPLCRGLATGAVDQPSQQPSAPKANELDDLVSPRDTFHILEADSSQHEAIEAVKRGLNLVLDGPPGTGKSQTIANIIAECLAQGKTVLFASEKVAALEVVKRRLDKAKLGDFCLECHSHKANKKQVIEELGRCLRLEPEPFVSPDHRFEELRRIRLQLNAYVRALHRPCGRLSLSPYQVHGRLTNLTAKSRSRFQSNDPLAVDAAALQEMVDAVKRFSECRAVIDECGGHPWRDCACTSRSLTLEDDIRHHFTVLASLLPSYMSAFTRLQELGFVGKQPAMRDLEAGLTLATEAVEYPTVPAKWFSGNLHTTGTKYQWLNGLVQDYQKLRRTRPEYLDAAIDSDWGTWRRAIQDETAHLRVLGLSPVGPLRAGLGRCDKMAPQLEQLMAAVEAVHKAAMQAMEHLRAPYAGKLPLRALQKLADSIELVTSVGAVPLSWFDSLRRQEIRQVAERGRSEALYLSEERKRLDALFGVAAFDPEAKMLLTSAMPFRSLIRRLRPRWRAIRREMIALYRGEPPRSTTPLLRDGAGLLEYHRRHEKLQEVGKTQREHLRATEQGSVQWDAVLADLQVVEQLEATVRLPAQARDALSKNVIDKDALHVTGEALKQSLHQMEEVAAAIQNQFGLNLLGKQGVLRDRPCAELLAWLNDASVAVKQRRDVLSGMAAVLQPEMDVDAEECKQHADTFTTLRSNRGEVRRVYDSLRDVEGGSPAPENESWEEKAKSATWLLKIAEKYGDHPPQALKAVVTDAAVRSQIAQTVRQISALRKVQFSVAWEFVCKVFAANRQVSTGIILATTPVAELSSWLTDRANDVTRLSEWIEFQKASSSLDRLSLTVLGDEVVQHVVDASEAVEVFLIRFYRLWLDVAYAADPALEGFRGDEHEKLIARFRELDQQQIRDGSKRIRARKLENAFGLGDQGVDAPDSSELGVLLREVNKKRRHLPLRQLFRRIPTLLRKLKPCLMMSPLAVSTFLDSNDLPFDLVIFDEASQVRPYDAVCALYRAGQAVVAGDQKQLPPTSFFERQFDALDDDIDGEVAEGIEDFESILDVCSTLKIPRKRLQWHYRSRRESLIAFSNENFYDRELVTFASVWDVDGKSGVGFEWVKDGRWQSGQSGGFNAREAERTADLVFKHLRENQNRSLGVITMNQRQQMLVIEEIEKRRREHPELEEFFSESRDEPFFVKNLENVQGDERDVILLSVGYAPDQGGTLAMRFGPLNIEGGQRRLNVAVTRARYGLTVVSSIRANDIDLTRTNARGVQLLRDYLDYAERGVQALASFIQDGGNRMAESPFEEHVGQELKKVGCAVRRQVGCGRYRIDLALVDPQHTGRYVLGIECDGATYHSSATARDRDRLRQSVLEEMGWRICRIWSTDWVRDPEKQVRRVLAEYEKALHMPIDDAPKAEPKVESSGTTEASPMKGNGNGRSLLPEYDFQKIEDVSQRQIADLVRKVLELNGATDQDDLIVTVARKLGFERTGSKISQRIGRLIRTMLRRAMLAIAEDKRIRIERITDDDLASL